MWVFSLFPIRASHPSFPVVYPPLIFLSFCLFPVKVSSSSQPITFQNQFLKLRKAIKITFKEPFSSSISDVAFLNPCLTCDQVTISFIPSHCWSLKEFSMFSLPQISILASYVQIFCNYFLTRVYMNLVDCIPIYLEIINDPFFGMDPALELKQLLLKEQ